MAVGGHPAVPFNGWIRCHIGNHSWRGVLFFSLQRPWWPEVQQNHYKYVGKVVNGGRSVCCESEMLKSPCTSPASEETFQHSVHISSHFVLTVLFKSVAYGGRGLSDVWQTCSDTSRSVTSVSTSQMCPKMKNLNFSFTRRSSKDNFNVHSLWKPITYKGNMYEDTFYKTDRESLGILLKLTEHTTYYYYYRTPRINMNH